MGWITKVLKNPHQVSRIIDATMGRPLCRDVQKIQRPRLAIPQALASLTTTPLRKFVFDIDGTPLRSR